MCIGLHLADDRSASRLLYFLLQHRAVETQPGRNSCPRFQLLDSTLASTMSLLMLLALTVFFVVVINFASLLIMILIYYVPIFSLKNRNFTITGD